MDNESQTDEGRSSRRGRFMGKLFKPKERKAETSSAASLDAFLYSSADNLEVTHPPPPPPPASLPKLAKLDTSISRYPQALAVNHSAQSNRPLAPGKPESRSPRPNPSPRPNKKGLVVRFADSYPEIIGEGGDESEAPVAEISKRKTAGQPPPTPAHRRSPQPPSRANTSNFDGPTSADGFQPGPLARSQTGYSSIYDPESSASPHSNATPISPPRLQDPRRGQGYQNMLVPGHAASARYLETSGRSDENRRSFIEIHQAQMRQAEGKAFAQAARTASMASEHLWEEGEPPRKDDIMYSPEKIQRVQSSSPGMLMKRPTLEYSPANSISSNASSLYPSNPSQTSLARQESGASQNNASPGAVAAASERLQGMTITQNDEALQIFVSRTRHLFELFRLHAESVKPLSACSLEDCARSGLWWFLKGRMALEIAVRGRPGSPKEQMQNELDRQQAYSNLAKGYWICAEAISEIGQSRGLAPDADISEVSENVVSALKKLSHSMKRNGFLPPEESFLPQTIDKSIWLEYPPMSQDMLALLSGNWGSAMTAMQQPMSTLHLLDALPVTDTSENFSYGRVAADAFLMEQGRDAQRYHFPCILSIVRPQLQAGLVFVLASQNGSIQLAIQENKNAGPSWDDVRWRNETCSLDIRLPRGFLIAVQLAQSDYRMLWSMYDFGAKIKSTLHPRSDEVVVFRSTLRSFQYIDGDQQSRVFPKEPVPQCEVAMFEQVHKENGPSGPRNWHNGFRICVVTGTRTRTLSGVHHNFPPQLPVQFGFFRADGDSPALAVKFENGRQRGRMVFMFNDDKERVHFHSLLTGTSMDHDEKIFADVPLKAFTISQSIREPTGMAPFSRMPWKAGRVVNDECGPGGEPPSTVLADRLKVVLEYQNGTVTDRINVEPGELRLRLEITNAKLLRLLRQPQQDMTISVSESQVPKELPVAMTDSLQLVKANQTIRSFEFNNLADLHSFQASITGYEVIFDALAVTFAIARRRMVVPIHKKWEAGCTRIQIVRQEDKQLQLLAFFENFQYGHCMNFVLKGTDVYESFHRSGKSGVKFVDAKFPLPRLPADKDGDYDDMAFVCLDLPDLPGEHDDISIMFEKESDRDLLCQCLPASVKGSARMSSRLK